MRIRRSWPLALLAVLLGSSLPGPPAEAGPNAPNTTVTVVDMAFEPGVLTASMGSTVTWVFKETHTTTSDQGFWDSRSKNAGQSYKRVFTDAGTYPYFCSIHPDMHGRVKVPLRSAGTPAKGYALRWSSRTSTPSSVTFDVQIKKSGSTTWTSWRSGTSTRTGSFNPAGKHTYAVRARTHVSGAGTSSWSPVVTLKLT